MTSFQEHIMGLKWRFLPLTQGQSTIVDADKLDDLRKQRWQAAWNKPTQSFYATRGESFQAESRTKHYTVRMHRQLLGLSRGDKRRGDHENCNTLDNRMINLRMATHAENQHNKRRQKNNTTGYKGVTKRRGYERWRAQIIFNGQNIRLGDFKNPLDAHKAYCEAARRLFGKFAREG
jgi:hypothetical protein